MEQSTIAWWWYGDDEGTFFKALFRNLVIFGAGVAAAPIVIPFVKQAARSLGGKSNETTSTSSSADYIDGTARISNSTSGAMS